MALRIFVGDRKPLDEFDIPKLAHRINVGEDHLRAFLEVESRSRGFDRNGRPIMLFEPHVFYRNLSGKERTEAVKQGLAYRDWGQKPYPQDSYPRLQKAIKINHDAALKACSIGLSQVLVENFGSLGYSSPEAMWREFMDDEEAHVDAMIRFILVNNIDDDLRHERWETVARVYNGPGYKKNRYHIKMAQAFAKYRRIPDLDWQPGQGDYQFITPGAEELKRIQVRLAELGYPEVGWADGKWGSKTRGAVLAFRADNNLPIVPGIDTEFLSALFGAPAREIGGERKETTASDLREAGSRQIAASDGAAVGGVLTGLGGAVAATGGVLDGVEDNLGTVGRIVETAQPYLEQAQPFLPWAALGIGGWIVYQTILAKRARVNDHRTGKTSFAGPVR